LCQSLFREIMVGRRGANFTAAELDSFLDAVEEIMPLSATHWDNVAAIHSARYPDTGHNVGSLKRKFKELHGKRVSTGDPNCPPAVRRAKRLKQGIIDLMDGTDLQSEEDEDDDDDGVPPLNFGGEDDDDADPLLNDNGTHPDDEVAAANGAILNDVAPPAAAVVRPQSRAGSVGSASGGRGRGVSRHRRAGVHDTPTNRPRTRARETSPEGGPGDRVANFMGMMMMNQASDREERREEREERRQEFRLQLEAQRQQVLQQQTQQQQQNMMMMMMMSAMGGNGRNGGGMGQNGGGMGGGENTTNAEGNGEGGVAGSVAGNDID